MIEIKLEIGIISEKEEIQWFDHFWGSISAKKDVFNKLFLLLFYFNKQ
jgi:hypothetical protein